MRSLAASIVTLLVPSIAAAQATTGLIGTVVDTSNAPIVDAEVIANGNRRARTDAAGAFRLDGLSGGTVSLRVRRLGYIAMQQDVTLRQGEVANVRVVLTPRPVLLDTIAIAGECQRFRFSGFACRRREGGGVFIDQNAIDSINPRFPADVFRGLYGFRVDASPAGLRVVPTRGWRCLSTLANGRPPSLANPLPRWPNEILGVEIYAHADSIPKVYEHYSWKGSMRCSLINYWTQLPPRNQKR
jgi:hypothetical protein